MVCKHVYTRNNQENLNYYDPQLWYIMHLNMFIQIGLCCEIWYTGNWFYWYYSLDYWSMFLRAKTLPRISIMALISEVCNLMMRNRAFCTTSLHFSGCGTIWSMIPWYLISLLSDPELSQPFAIFQHPLCVAVAECSSSAHHSYNNIKSALFGVQNFYSANASGVAFHLIQFLLSFWLFNIKQLSLWQWGE